MLLPGVSLTLYEIKIWTLSIWPTVWGNFRVQVLQPNPQSVNDAFKWAGSPMPDTCCQWWIWQSYIAQGPYSSIPCRVRWFPVIYFVFRFLDEMTKPVIISRENQFLWPSVSLNTKYDENRRTRHGILAYDSRASMHTISTINNMYLTSVYQNIIKRYSHILKIQNQNLNTKMPWKRRPDASDLYFYLM